MCMCFVLYFHLCLLDDESITKRQISIFFRFDNSKMAKRDLWHREPPTYESVTKYYLYVRYSL